MAYLISTYNGTGLKNIKALLQTTTSQVVATQEIHVLDTGTASHAARLSGWKCLLGASKVGKAGSVNHLTGGVGICVREELGLLRAEEAMALVDESVSHRLIFGLVEAPGLPTFLMASAYFPTGEGEEIDGLRARMFAIIGQACQSFAGPWLLAADFNLSPSELSTWGFVDKSEGQIVCTGPAMPSCKGGTVGGRVIDFFILARCLAQAVKGIRVDPEEVMSPHRSVQLIFHPKVVTLQSLGFARLDPLP